MSFRVCALRLLLILSNCIALVRCADVCAEEPRKFGDDHFSRQCNYYEALVTHMLKRGPSAKDPFAGEHAISNVILKGFGDQAHIHIDNVISSLNPSQLIGIESASDSRRGVKSLWLCKNNKGKVTIIHYDPKAQVTMIKWNVVDGGSFDKAYEQLSSVVSESEVVAESNTTHGTISIVTLGQDNRVKVSLRYPTPAWSNKDTAHYKAWQQFAQQIEAIEMAYVNTK